MESNIKRIIKLIQKTGDRFIVMDSADVNPYVIMSFNDYERLLDMPTEVGEMSETELLEKINKEIALWRSGQEKKEEKEEANLWPRNVVKKEPTIKKTVILEPININNVEPEMAENSESKEEEKEGNEEDKYYFEPVEN